MKDLFCFCFSFEKIFFLQIFILYTYLDSMKYNNNYLRVEIGQIISMALESFLDKTNYYNLYYEMLYSTHEIFLVKRVLNKEKVSNVIIESSFVSNVFITMLFCNNELVEYYLRELFLIYLPGGHLRTNSSGTKPLTTA